MEGGMHMKKWVTLLALAGLLILPIIADQDGNPPQQPVGISSVEIAAATPKAKIKPLVAFTTDTGLWTGADNTDAHFIPFEDIYFHWIIDCTREGSVSVSLMITGPKGSGPGGVGKLKEVIEVGDFYLTPTTWYYIGPLTRFYTAPGYYDYKWRFRPGGQIKARFVVY
jgi:hypothetical protein